MGRKHYGKGEIALYEQLLLFPQCFQKACFPGASKGVIVWEWVKILTRLSLIALSFPLYLSCMTHIQLLTLYSVEKKKKTRCVCETRIPPKRPFFEKCNLYI